MIRYHLIIVAVIIPSVSYAQKLYTDSLDYIALKALTSPHAWVSKFKLNPPRLEEDDFDLIKERFQIVDIKYSDITNGQVGKKEPWDKERVVRRKLKPNRVRIPFVGSPPRRKSIYCVSKPLYLNKEKTIAIISWSVWDDLTWNESSGYGEVVIFRLENGRWKLEEGSISKFIT